MIPQVLENYKYAQASCYSTPGNCLLEPCSPIHVSDGGGVSDRVREILVQTEVESYIKHIFPEVSYHPLAIP